MNKIIEILPLWQVDTDFLVFPCKGDLALDNHYKIFDIIEQGFSFVSRMCRFCHIHTPVYSGYCVKDIMTGNIVH